MGEWGKGGEVWRREKVWVMFGQKYAKCDKNMSNIQKKIKIFF